MGTNQNANDEVTIDLGALFREIGSNAVIIILAAVIGALAALFITKTLVTPQYTSTAKLYVISKGESDTINNSDLQAGENLTNDYSEIIQSRQVAETVIARIDLRTEEGSMLQYESLLSKVSVSTPTNSRVINISVSDSDPYDACDITNAILEASMEHIQDVVNVETISVVEKANIPVTSDTAGARRNMMYGAIIGAVIVIIVIAVIFSTNDTIRTSEDVERYLGLSTMALIPLASGEKKQSVQKRKRRVSAK